MTVQFNIDSRFNPDARFSKVLFGFDGKLLEVELNEMQDIQNYRMARLVETVFGSRPLYEGTYAIANGKLTVTNEIIVVGGEVILLPTAELNVAIGDQIYLNIQKVTKTKSDAIKRFGNSLSSESVSNTMEDPRFGEETTRRVQVLYSITKTGTGTGDFVKLCDIINNGAGAPMVSKLSAIADSPMYRQIRQLADAEIDDRGFNALITAVQTNLTAHENRTNNPHAVTASQVGAYTKAEADGKYETPTGAQNKVNTHENKTTNPHNVTASQVGAYTKAEADGKYETPTGAQNKVDNLSGLKVVDNRAVVPKPTDYPIGRTAYEFKASTSVGLNGLAGTYVHLFSERAWADVSGGYVRQTAYDGTSAKIWTRFGNQTTDTWGAWEQLASTALATGSANGLFSSADFTKLAGIEAGANAYTHPATHPATMITESVDKRFMLDAERSKLAGVATGANNYTHPATHPPSIIVQDASNRFMTDTERAKLNGIEAGANAYTHPTTHPATMIVESADKNFMLDAERTKLAGIATGANNYTHPATHPPSIIAQDASNRFMTDAERSKLAGIEAGANAYTHPASHPASMITEAVDKRFMLDAERTKLTGVEDGANNYTHPTSHPASIITEAVDKRFMLDAERTKLAGIATGANNYTHPATHPPSIIAQDASNRFMTDAERSKLAGIEAGANAYTHPATHPPSIIAQDASNRFMTDAERTKLSSVATGANNYVHPATHPPSIIAQDASNRFVTDSQIASWDGKETTTGAQTKATQALNDAKAYAMNMVSTGSTSDPNATQEAYILTNHANSPGGGLYWHILTMFYSSKTGNRSQLAITYNGTAPRLMIRHFYTPTWSAWVEMSSNALASGTIDGLMTSANFTKLAGIATGANNYVHPTGSGNNHIPAGGASGNYLRYSSAGVATWVNPPATDIDIADTAGYFTATHVEGALAELFQSVSNGKSQVATAITDKGVATSGSDSFATMATNISQLSGGGVEIQAGNNILLSSHSSELVSTAIEPTYVEFQTSGITGVARFTFSMKASSTFGTVTVEIRNQLDTLLATASQSGTTYVVKTLDVPVNDSDILRVIPKANASTSCYIVNLAMKADFTNAYALSTVYGGGGGGAS